MVKAASLLSQILSHFPRGPFANLVARHKAERAAKGFACWTQFVAMLFCQLARADSLREIENGLKCCVGKLKHLGVAKAPPRSALSYANAHRPADLFRDLFFAAYAHFQATGGLSCRKAKFRFKNKLLSFDSTTISLCLALFPWASYRKAKGGVKVHVGLDHDTYLPVFIHMSEAKLHDIAAIRLLSPNPGSIIAFDRAYLDFKLFGHFCGQGVFFVTRLKSNTAYDTVQRRLVPEQRGNIVSDDLIRLTGAKAADCPHLLRRVVVYDPGEQRHIELLTNQMEFGPTTISAIY